MPPTITVVGAGVIGVSLAHELTRRGADVTLLDRGEAGAGTTAATYGWVNAHDKTPEDYRALNLMGLRAHERAARTGTRVPWFHRTGLLEIARSDAEQEALEAKVRRLSRADDAAEMVTSRQLRRPEPGIRPEAVTAAAFFADEGWIDAPTMCSSQLQRAQAKGVTFLPFHWVTEIGSDGPEAVGPTAADGTTSPTSWSWRPARNGGVSFSAEQHSRMAPIRRRQRAHRRPLPSAVPVG